MCAKLIWVCSGSRPQGRFGATGPGIYCVFTLPRRPGSAAPRGRQLCRGDPQRLPCPIPTARFSKPATLRSRVEEYLRSSIMEGRMKGGERLREQELCEQLGISRSTLREALRTLEAERLISIEPHRGPTVIRITEKAAQDLYALRALLEGFAAHEFARLASDADIDRLKRPWMRCTARPRAAPSRPAGRQAQLLRSPAGWLWQRSGQGHAAGTAVAHQPAARRPSRSRTGCPSMAEIDLLFERIRSRDPEGAQTAARNHIVNAERTALDVLRSQQEEAAGNDRDRTQAGAGGAGGAAR